jgi:hypothetical protein
VVGDDGWSWWFATTMVGRKKRQSPKYAKRAGRNKKRAPGCIYTQAVLPEADILLHPQSLAIALEEATNESRKGRNIVEQ